MKKFFLTSFIFASMLSATSEFSSTTLISESSYEMLPYEISMPANQEDFFGFFEKYLGLESDQIKSSFMNSDFNCSMAFFYPNSDRYKTEVAKDPTISMQYKVVSSTNPLLVQGYTEKSEKNMFADFGIGNFKYSATLTDVNYDIAQAIKTNPSIPSLAKHELSNIQSLSTKTVKNSSGNNVSFYDFISGDPSDLTPLKTIFSPQYILISKIENNNLENLVQNNHFLTRSPEGKVTLKIQSTDTEILHEKGFVAFSQNQNAWLVINNWNNPSKSLDSPLKYGISISKFQLYTNGYKAATSCDFTKDGKLINYDFQIEK